MLESGILPLFKHCLSLKNFSQTDFTYFSVQAHAAKLASSRSASAVRMAWDTLINLCFQWFLLLRSDFFSYSRFSFLVIIRCVISHSTVHKTARISMMAINIIWTAIRPNSTNDISEKMSRRKESSI